MRRKGFVTALIVLGLLATAFVWSPRDDRAVVRTATEFLVAVHNQNEMAVAALMAPDARETAADIMGELDVAQRPDRTGVKVTGWHENGAVVEALFVDSYTCTASTLMAIVITEDGYRVLGTDFAIDQRSDRLISTAP